MSTIRKTSWTFPLSEKTYAFSFLHSNTRIADENAVQNKITFVMYETTIENQYWISETIYTQQKPFFEMRKKNNVPTDLFWMKY